MAFAHIQDALATPNTGTTLAKAFGSSVGAGNTLIAFATTDPNTTYTFSSPGDTWTTIGTFFNSTASQGFAIGFATGVTGGAKTVTVTYGAPGNFNGLILSEFSGAAGTVDVQTAGRHNASSTTPTDASMTTTVAGDLIMTVMNLDSSGSTVSAGAGFTLSGTDSSNLLSGEYQIQGAAGAIAATFGLSVGAGNATLSAAIKPSGATFETGFGQTSTSWHPGRGPNARARFNQRPPSFETTSSTTINGTATIVGAGVVTDVLSIQQAPVTAAGVGALTAQASFNVNATATITGAGVLTALVTQGAPETSAGAGTLTSGVVQGTSAAPAGAGALANTAVQGSKASPTGAGTVGANPTQQAAAGLSGAGAMAAFVTESVTLSATGAGALTASAGGNQAGVCSMAGAGSLSVTATVLAPVTMTGAGTLTAPATQGSKTSPTGAGVLTPPNVIERVTAAPTGAGVLTAQSGAGGGTTNATATIAGHGVLTVSVNPCIVLRPTGGTTVRPGSGTTTYALSTTARPGTGTTARPNTGETDDPC